MTRVPNSLDIAANLIHKVRSTPFNWETWNCCLWCAEDVLAITGEDKMANFRGRCNDRRSAMLLIKETGHRTLLDATTAVLGEPSGRTTAWRGDIVYHDGNIGVCAGPVAYFVGERGLEPIPMSDIEYVFRIR